MKILFYFCTLSPKERRTFCCFSSAVEHFLGKEEVPGSSPGNSSGEGVGGGGPINGTTGNQEVTEKWPLLFLGVKP